MTALATTVFLHVNKTGGMTCRGVLEGMFGEQFHVCVDPDVAAIEAALSRFACVEFHILHRPEGWIHAHERLAAENRWDLFDAVNLFTMVREPVDQTLSRFYFQHKIRHRVEPRLKALGIKFPETLDDFLDEPSYRNNQVGFLSGLHQGPGIVVGEDDLATAVRLLNRPNMQVGLTEQFDQSLRMLERITGRRVAAGQLRVANRNESRPAIDSIPESLKQRIRELNALDVELYRVAKQHFLSSQER